MTASVYRRTLFLATLLHPAACGEGSLDPDSDLSEIYGSKRDEPEAEVDAGAGDDTSGAVALGACPVALNPAASNADRELPQGDVVKPSSVSSSGFFVLDGRLYDKHGNDFVMRGVNNAHAWFDTAGRGLATAALDNVADYGFNTVRIVWQTELANPAATPQMLREIIACIVALEMVPMVELHDVTGVPQGLLRNLENGDLDSWQSVRDAIDAGRTTDDEWGPLPKEEADAIANQLLLSMAQYYSRPDVKEVLLEFEDQLLVNIANEWSGEDYLGGYSAAVQHLRDEGIPHTLVLDANGWGQNADSVLSAGPALLEADPEHNLLFSVHMYERYSERERITEVLEAAETLSLPLIIGEFGPEHAGQSIDTRFIFEEAARLSVGYLAWSWKGNSEDLAYLDLAVDWEGNELTGWGTDLVEAPFGVAETSQRASVFLY